MCSIRLATSPMPFQITKMPGGTGIWRLTSIRMRTALLEDLVERGLPTARAILVVIDGGKALYRAVRSVLGRRALIQR